MRRHLTTLAIVLGLGGCEAEHESRNVVDQFALALQYGDIAGMFAAHVDSTQQGEFCRKSFRDLLDRSRELSAEGCEQVRSLTSGNKEMPDELALAVQTGRWACEHPKGTCVDYARTVFEQAVAASDLSAEPLSSVRVRQLNGDATSAVAYVDAETKSGVTHHRTLRLKLVGEGWRVAGGFLTP